MADDTASWVAAWDQLSTQQDKLSRELLLTWVIVGLVIAAALLFIGGKMVGAA